MSARLHHLSTPPPLSPTPPPPTQTPFPSFTAPLISPPALEGSDGYRRAPLALADGCRGRRDARRCFNLTFPFFGTEPPARADAERREHEYSCQARGDHIVVLLKCVCCPSLSPPPPPHTHTHLPLPLPHSTAVHEYQKEAPPGTNNNAPLLSFSTWHLQ